MISLFREAVRFDASEPQRRRHVIRLELASLIAEARSRSRFYARDRQVMDALLEEPEDDRFFDAFRALRPVTRADLVTSFDRITTDREIDRAAVTAFTRTHPDGAGMLRTERGDHVVFGAERDELRVVDRARTTARVAMLVLFRALLRAMRHAPRTLALVPFLHALFPRAYRRAQSPHTPSLARRIRRFFLPGALVFASDGTLRAYTAALSGATRGLFRALTDLHLVREEALSEETLACIAWQRPELVFGRPRRIEALAEAQLAGTLRIDPLVICFRAEPSERARALVARAFPRAVVVVTYGTREIRAIATTCHECGALHVLEDLCYLELLDAHGQPSRPNRPANKVYATPLRNYTTPLLRYEVTDEITLLPDAGCSLRTARIRVRPPEEEA